MVLRPWSFAALGVLLGGTVAVGCTVPRPLFDAGVDALHRDAAVRDANDTESDGGTDAPVDARVGCPPGTVDLDEDPANGCEYTCTFVSVRDEPDAAFEDANCDGMDGEITNGIFVSTTAGDDTNAGTMDAPVATIARGEVLAEPMHLDVYVDAGTYAAGILLVDGARIYGGFDSTRSPAGAIAGTWDRRDDAVTIVMGGSIAVDGADLTMGAVLDGLTIRAADAAMAGQPSIGVRVRTSTGLVRISSCTIVAGAGRAGGNGAAGRGGASGVAASGQTAGTSTCGVGGGRGGNAGAAGMAGSVGVDAPMGGGAGGAAGTAVVCPPTSGGTALGVVGTGGRPGASGAPGMDGAGGNATGAIAGGIWVASSGVAGTAGNDGRGGGGGGAGSGGWARFLSTCAPYVGGVGGGGGSGGCGGGLGGAGGGGGASFGVLAIDATVEIRTSSITAGRGGDGGRGGAGGAGGDVGAPAMGPTVSAPGARGGIGGVAGAGGDGGDGGGGGGGPSIGAVHAGGGTLMTFSSTLTPGVAGSGGTSPGNAGMPGLAVMSREL